ncbi:MAG TPA: hypothetical protein VKV40_18530 [Ktedonobacteraceae bacterium]|nr:hypothetical protein [Ktedonobacteraceae bacterium]
MRRVFLTLCLLVLALLVLLSWLSAGGWLPAFSAPPLLAGTAASWSVVGAPSVSAHFLDEVLSAYHSPAAGLGQTLYDDGVAVNIDPVYALAFFWHESTFGRYGWANVNHSLGNIRCSAGYRCQGGFRSYATWQQGVADWYQLIHDLYVEQLGLRTVEQIVPVYAPSSDHNDVQAYIQAIEQAVQTWRRGQVVVS